MQEGQGTELKQELLELREKISGAMQIVDRLIDDIED